MTEIVTLICDKPGSLWPSPLWWMTSWTGSIRTGNTMMTSSDGSIFRVTGHLCEEFTGTQKPVTRSSGVFFDLWLNKWLSKQWWGRWFETPSRPLCRQFNNQKNYACGSNFLMTLFYSLLILSKSSSPSSLVLELCSSSGNFHNKIIMLWSV